MHPQRALSAILSLAALVLAACGDTTGLPQPQSENVVDTVSLYALDGTAVSLPSGLLLRPTTVVRTDLTNLFDFAFNITPAGDAVLLPTEELGLGIGSGIQVQSTTFDAITLAPTSPYVESDPVTVDSGTVAILRSRPVSDILCGVISYYGKIEVLAIDTTARRIDLQILVDQNCGYRGLEPGLPRR